MNKFIGLDVHFQSTTVVVLDEMGIEELRQVIPTKEQVIRSLISSIPGCKSLTFEESTMAQWLVAVLDGCVDKLVVCNPMYITKKTKAKTDYIDALHLAKELRSGNLTPVYHDHKNPILDLRLLISAYRSVVQQHVQTKNRFKTLFRAEGIEIPSGEKAFSSYEITRKLKSPARREIASRLLGQHLDLESLKEKYLSNFKNLSKEYPEINRLREIPGIDYVRALTIAAIVGQAQRFTNKHHYWSYCGLVRHKQISGGNNYGYKKSRGRSELKEVYIGAAESCLINKNNPFRKLYDRKRTGGLDHRAAKRLIARKIASITLAILKTGIEYDEKQII
ncbi:MAG: IS110 family transposase [Pseudomonadota bacterium]